MHRIQAISNGNTPESQINFVEHALQVGCRWVQFRFKNQSSDILLNTGNAIKKLCQLYSATFIINDHLWLAKELDSDGLHIGKEDISLTEARKLLGNSKIIGATANTLADVIAAHDKGADYIGLGPFRFTTTKEKLSPILGLEGYRKIFSNLSQKSIFPMVYAIGGIEYKDLESLNSTGVYGVAVSSLLSKIKKDEFEQMSNIFKV